VRWTTGALLKWSGWEESNLRFLLPRQELSPLYYTPMVASAALASAYPVLQTGAILSQLTDRYKNGGPSRLCPDRPLLARQVLS
jgi:hypothetical protein